MIPKFRVTFDTVSPESATEGEFEEPGFIEPGNWRLSLGNESPEGMTLREALRLVGPGFVDAGRWFVESEATSDYRTGTEETRSLHPPRNITRASYARLARLLRAR